MVCMLNTSIISVQQSSTVWLTVDARPCNVFVVLRRVRNSRTIIIIIQYNTKFVKRHVAVASEALEIRPTAKNRDQLRNSTLGNQVWATFFYAYSAMQCT